MPFIPAAFARLVEIVSRTIGLAAVPAVMLHGFVESVVRPGDSPLATIVALADARGAPANASMPTNATAASIALPKIFSLPCERHVSSILPKYPRLGWGAIP